MTIYCAIYRRSDKMEDQTIWIRDWDIFSDGRFEKVFPTDKEYRKEDLLKEISDISLELCISHTVPSSYSPQEAEESIESIKDNWDLIFSSLTSRVNDIIERTPDDVAIYRGDIILFVRRSILTTLLDRVKSLNIIKEKLDG